MKGDVEASGISTVWVKGGPGKCCACSEPLG